MIEKTEIIIWNNDRKDEEKEKNPNMCETQWQKEFHDRGNYKLFSSDVIAASCQQQPSPMDGGSR